MMLRIFFFLSLVILYWTSILDCKKIVCYFTSWSIYRPGIYSYTSQDIQVELCTDFIYSFIGLNDDTWTVKILDPEIDVNRNGFLNFTGLKANNPKAKFSVSLGGWGEGGEKYSEMVSCPERRRTFIRSVTDFLHKYKFHGLDLDWEYPLAADRGGKCTDRLNFCLFVQELKTEFQNQNPCWELTIAVPIGTSKRIAGYDMQCISEAVNFIHVMAYDLRSYEDGFLDVHSPLHARINEPPGYELLNGEDGMQAFVDLGCPPEQLIMGVPFYAKTCTLSPGIKNYDVGTPVDKINGAGEPGKFTKEPGMLAYYEVCELLKGENNNGWTMKWDSQALCPYMYKDNRWIGYENGSSLLYKMEHIKCKGYGGVMTWALDLDDFRGVYGEKNALLKVLQNS